MKTNPRSRVSYCAAGRELGNYSVIVRREGARQFCRCSGSGGLGGMGDGRNHRTPAPPHLATTPNTRHRSIPCISESHRFAWNSGIRSIHDADTGSPRLYLNTMRIVLAIERLFYPDMAAAQIGWLVYFTLRTVKSYFAPDFAIPTTAPGAHAGEAPALPSPPTLHAAV